MMSLLKFFLPLLVAMLIAGCGGGPSHTVTVAGHPCDPANYTMQCAADAPGQTAGGVGGPGALFGIDFAWGGPPGSVARAHGAHFGVSYLSGTSKDWTRSKIASYRSAGLGVVSVWETGQKRAVSGYSAGYWDARAASREAAALGQPKGRPIFFAVDTDASAASVAPYFAGVRAAIGKSRTGVYGGYSVVAGLYARGLIGHAWQTLAWSYGHWDGRACLRQTGINRSWFGYSVDNDLALCADYGQWFNVKPKLVCFGKSANRRSPICRKARAQVVSWQHAVRGSQRVYDARSCPKLAHRIAWYNAHLKAHPRYHRAARLRGRKLSRRAYARHHCGVFAQRVNFFQSRIHQLEKKYT